VPDRLEYLTSLHTIYFVQNKISKITGLSACSLLRSLELGGNKIRVSMINLIFKKLVTDSNNSSRKLKTSMRWSIWKNSGLGKTKSRNWRYAFLRSAILSGVDG